MSMCCSVSVSLRCPSWKSLMERACSCACTREAPRRPTSSLRRRGPKLLRACLCFNKACIDHRICLECVEAIHKRGAIDGVVCVHVRRRAQFPENGGGCPNQLKENKEWPPTGTCPKGGDGKRKDNEPESRKRKSGRSGAGTTRTAPET